MNELGGASGSANSAGGAGSGSHAGATASGSGGAGGPAGTQGFAGGNPGTAGVAGGHAGTSGAAGNAGTPGVGGHTGTPGAAGNAGTSAGAGGHAGTSSGAAGHAGTPGAGGNAGTSGGGAGLSGGGGAAGCSPCHIAVAKALCQPIASATCLEQQSSTTAADGTFVKSTNVCFSDGTKLLQVDTSPPGNAPRTTTIQRLRNGALCGTIQASSSSSVNASGNKVDTTTEVVNDPAGNLLATIVTSTTRTSGERTQTLTCAGQSPEPLVSSCIDSAAVVSCAGGTCM